MVSISLIAISVVDFVSAFFLAWPFPGSFMLGVGLVLLLKSIWSITASMAAGFWYDIFGFLDFVGAMVLIIVNFGTPVGFAWILAIMLALKAIYSIMTSI